MQPIYIPTYELFIILEPFRRRYREMFRALEPLADAANEGPLLLGTDAYYRADTDVALLAIRFDRRTMSERKLSWVLELCSGADLPVLDPARLGEADRREFYDSYLPAYQLRVEHCDGPETALSKLATELRLEAPRAQGTPPLSFPAIQDPRRHPAPPAEAGRYVLPRKTLESDPDTGETEPVTTPGPGAEPVPASVHEAPTALAPPPEIADSDRLVLGAAGSAPGESEEPPPPSREPPRRAARGEGRGKQKRRRVDPTLPATPTARRPLGQVRGGETPPPVLARIRRGDAWVPARLRSISLRGARVASVALPRLRDQVQLALAFGECGAVVHGLVVHVSSARESTESGTASFRIAFSQEDSPARRQLAGLLRRAREAGVSFQPPPRRSEMRLPLCWPIRVSDRRREVPAAALDVSSRGLFLATDGELARNLIFQLPLDQGDQPLHGRARIARTVSAEMAQKRGLRQGFGLEIVDLFDDQGRWRSFLDRVRRRSECRVAVAAADGRSRELAAGLIMAGYAACGRRDPDALLALIEKESRPPDAVLLDASLATGRDARWLRTTIEKRGVPCVSTRNERPDRVRMMLDRVLSVGM